jgi:hypothetical protein
MSVYKTISALHLQLWSPPAGEFISITVEELSIAFEVHRSLLEKHSSFFIHALNGRFIESDSRIISPLDDGAKTFSEFVSWLYSSCLFASKLNPSWLQLS